MIYDIALIYEFYVCFYRKETSIRVLTTEKRRKGTALDDYFLNRKARGGKGIYVLTTEETKEGTKGTELSDYFLTAKSAKGQGKSFLTTEKRRKAQRARSGVIIF